MKEESWKVVHGYDGLYRVSDRGRVQSCHKKGSRTGERAEWWALAVQIDKHGYEVVYLWDSGARKRVRCLVHQLVAQEFVPCAVELRRPAIDHVDGNRRNNSAENLEWVSVAANLQRAYAKGHCKAQKLTPDDVREIRSCGGNDTETAARFGVSQVLITRIRARKAWKGVE